MDIVKGQLLSKRPLSHKLIFADLRILETQQVIELVFKSNQNTTTSSSSETRISSLRGICIGDIIQVTGEWEIPTSKASDTTRQHRSFRCTQTPIVSVPWKIANPTNSFAPVYFDRSMYFSKTTSSSTSSISFTSSTSSTSSSTSSSTTTTNSSSLCKFFTSSLSCPKGDACRYLHTKDTKLRHEWVQTRRKNKRERQQLNGDVSNPHTKHSKCARADLFAKWIVETFGDATTLSQGSGILDIAG